MTACNLAPKYTATDMTIPHEWRYEADEEENPNIAWWKQLGDDVLNEYITLALDHNKDLKVAMWRVNEYLAQYKVIRSKLFPQVKLNAFAIKQKLPSDTDFLPIDLNVITPEYHWDVDLSYEIDFWGRVRNSSFAAYSEYLAQVENRRTVVLTLVGSVAQAYVLLRQLDLQKELAQNIMESRKESFTIASYRFEGGLTSKIEVDQSLSVYEESIAVLEALERQVAEQENLLCVLLGEPPHALKRGKPLTELVLPQKIPSGTPEDLLTKRPDILQVENLLKAANANIGVARAAFFPQFSFGALFGMDTLQLKTLFNKKAQLWTIGGSLLQQIFTGGALIGQLQEAKAQKEGLVFQYEQTILQALQEVNDAMIALDKSQKIVLADQKQVAALKDYLKIAWYRYYEGQTEYLTVLDAEREVFNAELNLAGAEAQPFLSLVDLYKSLGGGWVVQADNQALGYGEGS